MGNQSTEQKDNLWKAIHLERLILERSEKLNDGFKSAAYPLFYTPPYLDNENRERTSRAVCLNICFASGAVAICVYLQLLIKDQWTQIGPLVDQFVGYTDNTLGLFYLWENTGQASVCYSRNASP